MTMPPIVIVMAPVVIAMATTGFEVIRFRPLPIAQMILRLAIEPALIRGIIAGPVPFVRSAVPGPDGISRGCLASMQYPCLVRNPWLSRVS